jgi:hypothetical protein
VVKVGEILYPVDGGKDPTDDKDQRVQLEAVDHRQDLAEVSGVLVARLLRATDEADPLDDLVVHEAIETDGGPDGYVEE